MIPDIILNKIYWYIWRYKSCELCQEYRNSLLDISTGGIFMALSVMHNNKMIKKMYEFNYRICNNIDYCEIYDKHGNNTHMLPKNYIIRNNFT